MATFECVEEDEVVEDALCPVDVPNRIMNCNDTCDKCNPDGSCKLDCREPDICKTIDTIELKEVRETLYCSQKCCKCKKLST